MGGSNSTPRNITMEEESPGMVKVSESVARRLMGHPDEATAGANGRQVNEDELVKLQNYYEKKFRALDKKNQELYRTSTAQFAKAVEEVEQKFLDVTCSPICEDLQTSVLRCYQQNPKEPLHCSTEVRAFSECVLKHREKVLTSSSRKGS